MSAPVAPAHIPRTAGAPWLGAVILICAALAAGAADRGARVRVIATGGTIANTPAGRLTGEDLVARLPAERRLPRVEVETFANVPSAALTPDDCARLARHVSAVLDADADLDGIVITSGTDMLEELAWFLHLTVPGERPIVVVGAMRRPGAAGEDGPRNLADAMRVAASPDARGRGVLVVMHGQVHGARLVRKTHSTDLGAFDAPADQRAGTVENGRVRLARTARPLDLPPGLLALGEGRQIPRVDVLLTYHGAPGDLIDAAVANGARGVVLAAAGSGGLTPSQSEAAHRAARAGLPVVVASRTGAGAVRPPNSLADGPLIGAGTLAPLKARVLLALALARGMERREIGALFERATDARSSRETVGAR